MPDSPSSCSTPRNCWHAEPALRVVTAVQVDPINGLSSEEARLRLQAQGANRLAEKPPRSAWRGFFEQFRSLLVIVLLCAAVLAGLIGDLRDSAVIVVVVFLNAVLGFFQEYRAEAALAALKSMLAPNARVRRDGQSLSVSAADLVVGDILLLEAGDRIPADARVLEAHAAEVAEAALTGESQAVDKHPKVLAASILLAERSNMVFMNTVVTRGRIEAVVVATGMASEMGRLAGLLAEVEQGQTPLQQQLDSLGKRLAIIASIVVAILFVLGLARGDDLVTTIMTAIALAVAAIPEGLPAVVTVTLALGMQRMAAHNAIVKRLAAVETLGCTTVICTDKTGTLTSNHMTGRTLCALGERLEIGDTQAVAPDARRVEALALALQPAMLCNDAHFSAGKLLGDPTEGALLTLGQQYGLDVQALTECLPRLAEVPFDAQHKFMATFHAEGDNVLICVKGAPDVLLERTTHWLSSAGVMPVDENFAICFVADNAAMAESAQRVLALASKRISLAEFTASQTIQTQLQRFLHGLTLTALVGLSDPPRPEAQQAIRLCHAAGIRVKMITGDHRLTAAAIARELGLSGEVHEGAELDGLDTQQLAALVERSAVFARVAPEHKLRIVQALQAAGHVVAMTGDGVNDAPALKAADIGIAMGVTGTEVAKEAADMVLTDDNFASIVSAVREGRTIYDNIVKFVRFQLSTNIGAILTVLGAPLCGFPTPFTAIQILWVNIIMDGPPALTLGVEPARRDAMQQPPRAAGAAILTPLRLLRLAFSALIMSVGALLAYAHGLENGGPAYAATMAFTTFVLFQAFNLFNARAEHQSVFNRQLFTNPRLWLAVCGMLLLQVVVVHWPPAQKIFATVDLRLSDWGWAYLVAASVLGFEELLKLSVRLFSQTRRSTEVD